MSGASPPPLITVLGDIGCFKVLLEHNIKLNLSLALNSDGDTAVHMAVKMGSSSVLKLLIELGANVHATNNNNRNAAQVAVDYYNMTCLLLLLSNGCTLPSADINAVKKAAARSKNDGNTVLHYASLAGEAELVRLLLAQGADPKIRNNDVGWLPCIGGKTAAELAPNSSTKKAFERK